MISCPAFCFFNGRQERTWLDTASFSIASGSYSIEVNPQVPEHLPPEYERRQVFTGRAFPILPVAGAHPA